MHIPSGSFRVISILPSIVYQNCVAWKIGAQCHTHISSVKMNFDVFTPTTLDPNLSPLIIMHGLFGSRRNWRTLSKLLSNETNRKIYAVDARNHGDSPHAEEHGSIQLAVDVASFVEDEELDKVSVIGHSMGGRGMIVFTLKYPHLIEKTIIVDISPISMPQNSEYMMEILRGMKSAHVPKELSLSDARKLVKEHLIAKTEVDESTADFILLSYTKTPSGEFQWKVNVPTLLTEFPKFMEEQYLEWPPYTGPVLFVCGKLSPYMKPNDWPKVRAIFPNADIKWLDSGHWVHFDQPTQLIQEIRNFLEN